MVVPALFDKAACTEESTGVLPTPQRTVIEELSHQRPMAVEPTHGGSASRRYRADRGVKFELRTDCPPNAFDDTFVPARMPSTL